jgi:hypothetical protein
VRGDWIPDSKLPTPDDSHKMSTVEISEYEVECAFLGKGVNEGPGKEKSKGPAKDPTKIFAER